MSKPEAEAKRIDCDFAIIGSAIASTILGTILARRGHRVVLIEKGHHPKFAIGESTIPQTSLMLLSLGLRYDIPEFQQLSSFEQASRSVSMNCGKKSNFGFIFQRPGRAHDRSECHQLGVARRNFSETHFYRQDIDSHLLFTAIRYGCQVLQQTDIADIHIAGDAVTIRTDRNVRIRARCLVDGSGYDSLLVRNFALRETPTRVKARSRTLFVHMVDVQPFDRCVTESEEGLGKLAAWHEGTLHHIFRDGWMWVIPFDNHPAAMNPVCSVGLQLDPERRPKPDNMEPFEEFRAIIDDYPEIRAQFRDAKPVRNWVSSGRLQYSASSNVGDRWCLLSHSGGFVDPLFSRGLSNTVEVLNVAAATLLAAARDDDFSTARLMPIETVNRAAIEGNDTLVHGAYISFRNFGLWNAWFRIWGLTQVYGISRFLKSMVDFENTGMTSAFEHLDRAKRPGALTPDHPEIVDLIDAAYASMRAFDEGRMSAETTERAIFDLLAGAENLPPNFPFVDPTVRFGRDTLATQIAVDSWLHAQLLTAG
jgi:FADH2 O2-dependent halogenase